VKVMERTEFAERGADTGGMTGGGVQQFQRARAAMVSGAAAANGRGAMGGMAGGGVQLFHKDPAAAGGTDVADECD
jgi:hypothetical protein